MKKSIFSLFTLWCIILLYGCHGPEEFFELEKPVPAIGFKNFPETAVRVDTALNLQILFQTENGCGRYSRVDSATVGKEFTLKYFVTYPAEGSEVVCADVSRPLVFNKSFRPRQSGTYRFRFWVSNGQYEEKFIEVK